MATSCRSQTARRYAFGVERQLGYKQARYIQRVEAVESPAQIHGGKGGYCAGI